MLQAHFLPPPAFRKLQIMPLFIASRSRDCGEGRSALHAESQQPTWSSNIPVHLRRRCPLTGRWPAWVPLRLAEEYMLCCRGSRDGARPPVEMEGDLPCWGRGGPLGCCTHC